MKNTATKVSMVIREIKKYAKDIIEAKQNSDLAEAFEAFDLKNTGVIDSEELKEIMYNISSDITQE